jgi:hypothetical protein
MLANAELKNFAVMQCKQHFRDKREKIKSQNLQLNAQIDEQLKRLEGNEQENTLYNVDEIYKQIILCNNIKDTEKEFTARRHSCMQFITEYMC